MNREKYLECVQTIMDLELLGDDWDGYGAASVRSAAVGVTLDIFNKIADAETPVPSIYATTDGGAIMEFKDAFIEVDHLGEISLDQVEDTIAIAKYLTRESNKWYNIIEGE